jgi:RsiW-degrading membrane proteinase PrsW (M82 family)
MLLLTVAIAPGIAICLFIYSWKKNHKAPLGHLILAFILGMISTLPALWLQSLAEDVRDNPARHSILSYVWYAFIVVAFSEEGSKFLLLRLYAYPKRAFTGPFDGIIYAVMIGMGFATVENMEYVIQFGLDTGLSRFFLAVPAHASFAVLMGYNAGLAKSRPWQSGWLLCKGLLIAVLFHGSFDFFVFMQQNQAAARYFSTGMLSFGAFASFYIAVRLAMRAIRMHAKEASEEPESGNVDNESE